MTFNFSKECKIIVVSPAVVAGTSEVDSSIVDTAGFDGVAFIALTGALTATSVVTLAAQQNTLNQTGGMAAIPSGATPAYTAAGTESQNAFMVDVYKPQQRYVRAALTRTVANAVVNSIIAVLYKATRPPIIPDVSMLASQFVVPTA